MSVSTDQSRRLRQDAAAGIGAGVAERCSGMLEAEEAAEYARVLTEKYGADALAFAHHRAQRAIEVGDELALAAWRAVIAATQGLLRQAADA
jgi:hypothetical protein